MSGKSQIYAKTMGATVLFKATDEQKAKALYHGPQVLRDFLDTLPAPPKVRKPRKG